MCISHHGDKHSCCCGCPLIVGVLIIFILDLFSLYGAIVLGDYFSIAISGILGICFVVAFVKSNDYLIREYLYRVYMTSFIIMLIYFLWFSIFSGKVTDQS